MLSESRSVHAPNALSEDEVEEQRAAISFGDKPLIVLTAGLAPKPRDETEEEHLRNLAHWKAGHERLAARSSNGRSTVVTDASHMIQLDQPNTVTDAIQTVVSLVRRRTADAR
jgi:pimeloyl-ACP methyl ester carboxylesterase